MAAPVVAGWLPTAGEGSGIRRDMTARPLNLMPMCRPVRRKLGHVHLIEYRMCGCPSAASTVRQVLKRELKT